MKKEIEMMMLLTLNGLPIGSNRYIAIAEVLITEFRKSMYNRLFIKMAVVKYPLIMPEAKYMQGLLIKLLFSNPYPALLI